MSNRVRHFTDATGRHWAISETPPSDARLVFPGELFFGDPPTVSLVFTSEDQRRCVPHAPAHWYDLSYTSLSALLRQALPCEEPRGGIPPALPTA